MKSALIVVDVQNDFCPGGALPVKNGNKIIPAINRLVELFTKNSLPVFFTRDWHPPNHCSFKQYGGIWPPHCIQNSWGAEFHSELDVPKTAVIVSKATRHDKEAYSGFDGTDLASKLGSLDVKRVVVTGLAADYCVKNTVLDALKLGFEVVLPRDCTRGVNIRPTDSIEAFIEMKKAGAKTTYSKKLVKEFLGHAASSSSS
jgi:nicotinamidase/pyrazinamidase